MKYLIRYTCAGKGWTTYATLGRGGGERDFLDHYHSDDPFKMHSVTEVPDGMWMYSVTSRLAKLAYAPTYTFVAANVEDAARQTYAKWSADVGGAFTSAEVTILKIEMGENPCEHMEGLEEEEE